MKKLISGVLCAALILSMLLTLAGCGVAGRYLLKEVSYGGISMDAEDAGMDPDDCYIEMKSDGTAVMCMDGEEVDMQWKDGEIWAEGEEDDKADFEIEDGELTIEIEGIEMVFEKE